MEKSLAEMMQEVQRMLEDTGAVSSVVKGDVELIFEQHPNPEVTTPVFRGMRSTGIRETTPEEKEANVQMTRSNGYEGRGPTGRLRNIKQMDDPKLIRTHQSVRAATLSGDRPDPEALEKLEEELRYRTWLAGQWIPSYDLAG